MGVGGLVEVFMLWATSRKLEIVLCGGGESMLWKMDVFVLMVPGTVLFSVQLQVASIFGALDMKEDITIASLSIRSCRECLHYSSGAVNGTVCVLFGERF